MSPVKSRTRPDTATERRLREVCVALGLGRALPLAWLADRAGVPRSTLKNAAARDSLTHDVAEAIARLFEDEPGATVTWLRSGSGEAPHRPRMWPRRPATARSGAVDTPIAAPCGKA